MNRQNVRFGVFWEGEGLRKGDMNKDWNIDLRRLKVTGLHQLCQALNMLCLQVAKINPRVVIGWAKYPERKAIE
jgi:hypothetical protein